MFRIFNSFQVVALFSGLPFVGAWLYTEPFPYSRAALIATIVAYVVAFIFLTIATADFAKEETRR